MPNYNYTPINYFVSSVLSEEKKKEDSTEDCSEIVKAETILDFGYLYSIELRRNEIRKKLSEYFEFDDDKTMLDFLATNTDVLQVLPLIAKFILTHISNVNKLSVSLLNENVSWKTLFVNIYSNASWKETNEVFEIFFNALYETRPSTFNKINFNFCQE